MAWFDKYTYTKIVDISTAKFTVLKSCFLSTALFFSLACSGQVDLYPAHFSQLTPFSTQLNPSFSRAENRTAAWFANQFFTGPFSRIDNMFFQGVVALEAKDSSSTVKHGFGFRFFNESEGEFISRPRYFGLYTAHARLSEQLWLGLGASIGRSAYQYKGSGGNSLGSDEAWDGDIGLCIYNNSYRLGLSVNQWPNTTIQPRELLFKWRRFYTSYGQASLHLRPNLVSRSSLQFSYLPSMPHRLDVGSYLLSHNLLLIGANVYWDNNLAFVLGLENVAVGAQWLSLVCSYGVPYGSASRANVQTFEISVRYTR